MSRRSVLACVLVLAVSPTVRADGTPWKDHLGGMTPLAEADAATPAQAQLLVPTPADQDDSCDVQSSPAFAATYSGLTVVASIRDGVGVFTAHGETLARLDSLDCAGSQSGLRAVAFTQLLPDPDPEIVVVEVLGGRHDFYTDVVVLKLHGGKLVKILEYQEDGLDDSQEPLSTGHARILPGGGIEVLPAGEKVAVHLEWDWKKFAYDARPAAAADLPHLAADFNPAYIDRVTATSVFPSKTDAYAPWRTLLPTTVRAADDDGERDLDFVSAWCEGKPDEGLGEGITITLGTPLALQGLAIGAGVWKTAKLFAANNRPTRLTVTLSDGRTVTASVPGDRSQTPIDLGGAPVTSIQIAIAAVAKGAMNDSCLSFVSLRAAGRFATPLVGLSKAALDALPVAVTRLGGDLATCKAAALAADLDFPLTVARDAWGDGGQQKPKVARFADAKAFVQCRCPIQPLDAASLQVEGHAPGMVRVYTHQSGPLPQFWRLAWRGAAWHLAGVEYRQ